MTKRKLTAKEIGKHGIAAGGKGYHIRIERDGDDDGWYAGGAKSAPHQEDYPFGFIYRKTQNKKQAVIFPSWTEACNARINLHDHGYGLNGGTTRPLRKKAKRTWCIICPAHLEGKDLEEALEKRRDNRRKAEADTKRERKAFVLSISELGAAARNAR